MNDSVTLSLPHELFARAQAWATQSGRPLEEFLTESLEVSLSPFSDSAATIRQWSDQRVVEVLQSELAPEQESRLSQLLRKQQNERLTAEQSLELQTLMTVYQEGLLAKSAALREAVRRGLRSTPKS